MADINSSDLVGGGGLLKTSAIIAAAQLNTGTTADLTISCPSGKYLKLTLLTTDGGLQGGVTLTVGGRTLISSGTIQRSSTAVATNTFKVGLVTLGSNGIDSTNLNIVGGKNEDMTFSFDSATTQIIRYAYEVLENA